MKKPVGEGQISFKGGTECGSRRREVEYGGYVIPGGRSGKAAAKEFRAVNVKYDKSNYKLK